MVQRLRVDDSHAYDAFGVRCHALLPWEATGTAPFGASWVRVEPGQRTLRHAHLEREVLFVAEGAGEVTARGECFDLRTGDVVFLEGGVDHVVIPTGANALVLLSTYWLDAATAATLDHRANLPARLLVTAAPPTPNGVLHLGHISGPYLAGDILTRFYRLAGADVRYVTGSDDNQSWVQLAASRARTTPEALAELNTAKIVAGLEASGIALDAFVRPNASAVHKRTVTELFERLVANGKVELRTTACPYCTRCERYLYEAFVAGGCPSCGAKTCGNSCEPCGRPNDSIDLVNPRCTTCESPADKRDFSRWVFPLTRYVDFLEEYHRRLVGTGAHVRSFCFDFIKEGLRDIAITHPSTWGIPVPGAEVPNQTFYVWFEMAARYLAYPAAVEGFGDPWRPNDAEGSTATVQCFGFDNAFFYTLFIPALMHAFDPSIRLPRAFVANEFYQLEGSKFSTSRNHAVWALDILDETTADGLRDFLCRTRPGAVETEFDFRSLLQSSEALTRRWQRWLTALDQRLDRFERVVPVVGEWTPEDSAYLVELGEIEERVGRAFELDRFRPAAALASIDALLERVAELGAASASWQAGGRHNAHVRTALALELATARALAIMVSPVMPRFAQTLYSALGLSGQVCAARWPRGAGWIEPGTKVSALPAQHLMEMHRAIATKVERLRGEKQ